MAILSCSKVGLNYPKMKVFDQKKIKTSSDLIRLHFVKCPDIMIWSERGGSGLVRRPIFGSFWPLIAHSDLSLINDQWSTMKKCQNWLQKNSLGWKITFPGSVFYAGNDGDTHFAQKQVKWSKMKVFDQKKNLPKMDHFRKSDFFQRPFLI